MEWKWSVSMDKYMPAKERGVKEEMKGYNLREQLTSSSMVLVLALVSFLPYMVNLELYDDDPDSPYEGASRDPVIDIVNAVLVACMSMMLLEALLDSESRYIPIKIAFPRFIMVLGVLLTTLALYLHEESRDSLDRLNFLICSHYARIYFICGGISLRLLRDSKSSFSGQTPKLYILAIFLFILDMQLKQWKIYFPVNDGLTIFQHCVTVSTLIISVCFAVRIGQLVYVIKDSSEDKIGHSYYDLTSHAIILIFVIGANSINIGHGLQTWKNTTANEIVAYHFVALFVTVIFFFMSSYIAQRHFVRTESQLMNKKSFVRYVSHEIRTPLNTVYVGIQLLTTELRKLKSKNRDESGQSVVLKLQDIVNDISESCFVSIDILNDLLLIDKIEEGNLKLDMQAKNAKDLFLPCIRNFDVQAKFSRINFSVDLQAINYVTVNADESKIVQVVRNIVGNAFKFTPNGGHIHVQSSFIPDTPESPSLMSVHGTINRPSTNATKIHATTSNLQKGKIRIEFLDTGRGISEVNKAKLFDSVIQFNVNELQSGGGSGLGLFISNAIMKRHPGGHIGVMPGGVSMEGCGSEEGCVHLKANNSSPSGCIFFIEMEGYLNYDQQFATDNGGLTSNTQDYSNRYTRVGSFSHYDDLADDTYAFDKVLVTDDSKFNRKMMGKALANYAKEIVMAGDGEEAVAAVRQCEENHEQPFDIIFMDSLMPNMNGIDATKVILQELKFRNPIVAVTGNMLPEDVKDFESAGVRTVLGKPLDLGQFHEVLRGMLYFHCFFHFSF